MMSPYSLVYSESVYLRNFSYATQMRLLREHEDSAEEWKGNNVVESVPRGITTVPYRIWMRNPGTRAVVLLECPNTDIAFGAFGRIMDLIRSLVGNVRPWRVFALVAHHEGCLAYEIIFRVVGDEYIYQSCKPLKIREISGIVGNEHLGKTNGKP